MTANDYPVQPFMYQLFGAGYRLSEDPSTTVKDRVIQDCSGAYDFIDQCLQKHPNKKDSSIFAIADKNQRLMRLEEFADISGINKFFVMPIPYLGEEKKVLKRKFPADSTIPFWLWALGKLIPDHHHYDAFQLAHKLLEGNHDIIICSDKHDNIRIVVSTLRGEGVIYRTDLLNAIGNIEEPCGSFR